EDPDLRFATADRYPLAACAGAVVEWRRQVEYGRGFLLVRGLRTELYSDALSAAIYYILGLHMGEPIRQTEQGDLIDHIYATSDKKMTDITARPKKVRDSLVYHSDSSDVAALMCLRTAKSGGASCLVSAAEIYNEVLRRRPDLAPLFFQPTHFDWKGKDPDAPANTYVSPLVSLVEGVFSMYFGSTYVLSAPRHPEVPPLTEGQIELCRLFDELTQEPGMAIEMDFRPGDIQWLSNSMALHSRTAFEDHPEPQRRRHLLRLWLMCKTPRPTVPNFGRTDPRVRAHTRSGGPEHPASRFNIREAAVPRPE
ncbi:MAG TPA: TauD/TfdA family dioxygenase, partial [Alphaproteobacteria bacterium]|nr:TauD/TfdA family dioxygenase [Alphaproteobacteria bacterium]